MTSLTIAALVAAVLLAAMLIAALVLINGLGTKLDELAGRLKAVSTRQPLPQLPAGLEERLLAIEAGVKAIPAAHARLERSILAERREKQAAAAATASPAAPPAREDATIVGADHAPLPVFGSERAAVVRSHSESERQEVSVVVRDDEQPVTPDELIEAYRELIVRPRKNEITRWFDDLDGMPCEATDENVFQLVGRGEGARLVLVPLTERFGLVLPSALMVVDFATSFSDVLGARSATRQTFALDADGSGTLRLVQPAMAVLADGAWRLKAPGRLAGLATG